MKQKIIFFLIFFLIVINVYSETIDYNQILDDLTLESVTRTPYFNYRVTGNVNIHQEPANGSKKITVSPKKIYTIQRYEDSFWYICITEQGDKGYIELSTVDFLDDNYQKNELVLLNSSERFNRFGPLLIYRHDKNTKVFEDKFFWEDSNYYQLTLIEEQFFAVVLLYFEASNNLLFYYDDLKNPVYASSVPVVCEEYGKIYTCGRSFYPPDSFMIFDLKNELNIVYIAWVNAESQALGLSWPNITIEDSALNIKYKEYEDIKIKLDKNGIPIEHPALNIRPLSVGVLTDDKVRIRKRPNLNGKHIAYLQKDDIVEIINRTEKKMKIGDMDDFWYKIRTNDGIYGWTYGFFVDIKK